MGNTPPTLNTQNQQYQHILRHERNYSVVMVLNTLRYEREDGMNSIYSGIDKNGKKTEFYTFNPWFRPSDNQMISVATRDELIASNRPFKVILSFYTLKHPYIPFLADICDNLEIDINARLLEFANADNYAPPINVTRPELGVFTEVGRFWNTTYYKITGENYNGILVPIKANYELLSYFIPNSPTMLIYESDNPNDVRRLVFVMN
jgi:hypothetical protein